MATRGHRKHAPSEQAMRLARKRMAQSPSREQQLRVFGWTPGIQPTWSVAQVRSALLSHEQGDLSQSAQLMDAVGRDDRIHPIALHLARGLLGLPLLVAPPKGSENDPRAIALADRWRDAHDRIFPIDHQVRMLLDFLYLGVALAQVTWVRGDLGEWEPRVWNELPHHLYWQDDGRGGGSYVYQTVNGPMPVEPGDGRWILVEAGERGYMNGAIRALGELWLIRRFSWRDFARWCERHGLPIIKAKHPAGGGAGDEIDLFWEDVRSLGSETSVLLPQGVGPGGESYDLDLLEARDGAWRGLQELKNDAAVAAAVLLLGQNLTTEVQGGSFAAANVHKTVKRENLAGLHASYYGDIRDQLVRPVCEAWALGGARVAPIVGRDLTPPADKHEEAEVLNLVSTGIDRLASLGAKIDVARAVQRWDLPVDPDSRLGQQLFGYHLDFGIVDVDEARARLSLDPKPDGEGGKDRPLPASSLQLQAPAQKAIDEPASKPFAGFESFEACVIEQLRRGQDEAGARRICGALQAEAEKAPALSYREEIEQARAREAADAFDVAELQKAIDGARSFEEVEERVAAHLGPARIGKLSEALRRALILAELSGMLDGTEEALGELPEAPPQSALQSPSPDDLEQRIAGRAAHEAAVAAAQIATKLEQRAIVRDKVAGELRSALTAEQEARGEQARTFSEEAKRLTEKLAEAEEELRAARAEAQRATELAEQARETAEARPLPDEHRKLAELHAAMLADVKDARDLGLRGKRLQVFADAAARRYGVEPIRVEDE